MFYEEDDMNTGSDAGASTEDTGAESTGEETPAAEENAEGGEQAGM